MSTAILSRLPGHAFIAEPSLQYHPERRDDVHIHPLKGLIRFGPYSRSVFGAVPDPIRLAVIAPPDGMAGIKKLLSELEGAHQPKERRAYLVPFKGFSATFGCRTVLEPSTVISLPNTLETDGTGAAHPHDVLADHVTRAIAAVKANRSRFDVLLIYLPDRWEAAFRGSGTDDFDLHDYIKGVTATAGIPAQIIRESGAMNYFCRCSVMWRLSIAIYCKAGGIPWKLAYADDDTAYIGLGYAIRYNDKGEPTFVTCCSQVFDHDGTGLEFVAYETPDMHVEHGNPFLKREEMNRVMTRSLALYQHRHEGRPPKRVTVHKLHEWRTDEIKGCFDAMRGVESIDLVQIQQDSFWRGVHLDPPKVPEKEKSRPGYACKRGSYLIMGEREALLWTQGNVPQESGQDFFKEMKGTPSPLMLRRFAGHGPFSEVCNGILGLTKMNWNNDALYDRLPVTLGFAKSLAQTMKRLGKMSARPYPFRLFM